MGRTGAQRERDEEPEPQVFRQANFAEAGPRVEKEEQPGPRGTRHVVEPLRYLSLDGEEFAAEPAGEAAGDPEPAWEERLAAQDSEWKARMEKVRQEALAAGRAEMEGHRMELLRACTEQWRTAVGDFAHARDSYFARVEREVVDLALAIAARILQREAQVDPLLLAGAVRVALGQLAETTTVELRVPAEDQELWSETLRLMPNLPVMPTVVPDSELSKGECELTTELGRVDLGVRAQLKEIERGFFDLLSHRDAAVTRRQARTGL